MNLNHILTFVRVAEERSFSAAARRLQRLRSQVSRDVRALEEAVGVRLLERTTRQVHLTESGRLYFQRCKAVLDELEDATQAIQGMQHELQGSIRITAPVDLGPHVVAPMVAAFLKQYPQLKIELNCTQRLVNLIEEQIDLGIRIARELQDSSFVARKLGSFPFQVYASAGWIRECGTPHHPQDLEGASAVLFQPKSGPVEWRLNKGQEEHVVQPRGSLVSDDLNGVLQGVLHGLGVGVLPRFMAASHLESGRLVRVLPEWSGSSPAVYALHPSRRLMPPKVRVLIDFLSDSFQQQEW